MTAFHVLADLLEDLTRPEDIDSDDLTWRTRRVREAKEAIDQLAPATITAVELADLMDDCSDDDGQWNGADICDALASLIDRHGGWTRCDDHGVYSVSNERCPRPPCVDERTLTRDITAGELAMDDPDDEGYAAGDVIGPAGTKVHVITDEEGDPQVEVNGFANDEFAAGWVPREALS